MTAATIPLVCIGGTLCDARVFASMLDHLGRPAQSWFLDVHERVEAAGAAMLAAVSGAFVAVGFSLGGFVAIEAMRQAPDRVRGLVLISGNAFPDAPENAIVRRADVAAGRALGLANWLAGRHALLFPQDCIDRDARVSIVADMAGAVGDDVHERQAEMNIHRPDFRDLVAAARQPILALAGSEDALCPAERYRALSQAGNVRLEIIVGAGHYLPLEAPEPCAHLIDDFLRVNEL